MVAFRNFTRRTPEMFLDVVERLTPRLQKKDTWYIDSLEVGLKVAITRTHLATGGLLQDVDVSVLCAAQHHLPFRPGRLSGHLGRVRRRGGHQPDDS